MKKLYTMIGLAALVGLMLALSVSARMAPEVRQDITVASPTAETPAYGIAQHNVGKLALSVANNGTLGDGFSSICAIDACSDFFTGQAITSCEYPRQSNTKYLFAGAFWIGAVVGQDTLVSVAADGWSQTNEFHPDEGVQGEMVYRSTLDPDDVVAYYGAVSEQDYVSVYFDTCVGPNCPGSLDPDFLDGRTHRPLNVKVTQNSYAWSAPQLEDLVLFDYTIENVGFERLENVYFGIYVDGDVHQRGRDDGAQDDICGFKRTMPTSYLPPSCPADSDVVNMAWIADNDGDFDEGAYMPVPHITGVRILRTPSDSLEVSFNWWISNHNNPALDFGPQTRANYRDYQTGGTGTPMGDRNKYHVLRNGEFDYDQVFTAQIDASNETWMPPPESYQDMWSRGMDTRYLLSFGPFDIEPGAELPLTLAYVAGENFHTDANNLDNLPGNPQAYYDNVDFSDLARNAVWADWVYDNPGYDTDNDGYAGEFYICGSDTVWVKGDGVPDLRAATPPVAPDIWVEPATGALTVRWNGHLSETRMDGFSRELDFEGYNVYYRLNPLLSSYVLAATYDVEDFHKYYFDQDIGDWLLSKRRYTIEDLLCAYAPGGCTDATWHPLQYPRHRPFIWQDNPDSVFYFTQIGNNAADFGHETPIVKIYPDAPKPAYSSPSQVPQDSVGFYLTDDGYFKYYEYSYTIPNLLVGESYFVSVTAFDYGSFATNALPMESSIPGNSIVGTPAGCCTGESVGDLDGDGIVSMADMVRLISFLFITFEPIDCITEADIDLSGQPAPTAEDITMADLLTLIDSLFISLTPLPPCP